MVQFQVGAGRAGREGGGGGGGERGRGGWDFKGTSSHPFTCHFTLSKSINPSKKCLIKKYFRN